MGQNLMHVLFPECVHFFRLNLDASAASIQGHHSFFLNERAAFGGAE